MLNKKHEIPGKLSTERKKLIRQRISDVFESKQKFKQWRTQVDEVLKNRNITPMDTYIDWQAYFNCNYRPEAAVYDVYQGAGFDRRQGEGWS